MSGIYMNETSKQTPADIPNEINPTYISTYIHCNISHITQYSNIKRFEPSKSERLAKSIGSNVQNTNTTKKFTFETEQKKDEEVTWSRGINFFGAAIGTKTNNDSSNFHQLN